MHCCVAPKDSMLNYVFDRVDGVLTDSSSLITGMVGSGTKFYAGGFDSFDAWPI